MQPEDGFLAGCGIALGLALLSVVLSLLWLAIVLAKHVLHAL